MFAMVSNYVCEALLLVFGMIQTIIVWYFFSIGSQNNNVNLRGVAHVVFLKNITNFDSFNSTYVCNRLDTRVTLKLSYIIISKVVLRDKSTFLISTITVRGN